jgi:methanethiol S-methyltransferase
VRNKFIIFPKKNLNARHWILIVCWVIYYICHSVFAATSVKDFFQNNFKRAYRYYRLIYSIIAAIWLVAILIFQYSFGSPLLFSSIELRYVAALLLVIPGLVIMYLSVKKYFMLLSGIRSLYEPAPAAELKIDGIHRWVRHPLYSGTLLFVWGLFFIFPLLNNALAVSLLTLYVLIGIRFEEKKLVKEFGAAYIKYKADVPMLIPHINKKGSREAASKVEKYRF